MKTIIVLLALTAIVLSLDAKKTRGLPVLYFHGMGSSCNLETITGFIPYMRKHAPLNNEIYCVEYARLLATEITSMTHQGESACNIVEKNADKWDLKSNGFILLGSSQGSLAARYVLQACDVGQYAKVLITNGGPNMGVIRLPNTDYSGKGEVINNITDDIVYNDIIQNHVGPAGYFRSLRRYDDYLKKSNFLAAINNESTFNQTYKDRMTQLEKFVMIKFL